jgi:UDP-N-acetylmuramoylalanine--D-glutamate ligase
VLIAGGRAKDADFAPLVAAAEGRLVGAVVIGEAAAELQAALSPTASVQAAQDMREAVGSALEIARAATARPITVLLSPACASLDMYPNYRKRGDVFVEAVKEHLG